MLARQKTKHPMSVITSFHANSSLFTGGKPFYKPDLLMLLVMSPCLLDESMHRCAYMLQPHDC